MSSLSLAIIPARGGSKRIPRKNVRSFCGQPILSYPLAAAQQSGSFQEIMVSTDDEEISELAVKLGASVPFKRSPATASDTATTSAVLIEVLENYRQLGRVFEYACCIYPTAALLSPKQIETGWRLLASNPAWSMVFAAQAYAHPIQRALRLENGGAKFVWPENSSVRTQDLEPLYYDSGQFYWFRTAAFLECQSLWAAGEVGALVIESGEAHDLDVESEWTIAEAKYLTLQRTHKNHGN